MVFRWRIGGALAAPGWRRRPAQSEDAAMAYNRFTIESIRKTFGVRILGDVSLFENIAPVDPGQILVHIVSGYQPSP